ncbi:hypothetical protein LWI29_034011 [Acer saccharum]|uniref:Uncharacterized protein n=1 Tax=Acer saccharum TaxID=4024 RepID=A0AA39RZI5_ACESA|nr:hypothetical protein LWI29_034011 [Acer saccharum]
MVLRIGTEVDAVNVVAAVNDCKPANGIAGFVIDVKVLFVDVQCSQITTDKDQGELSAEGIPHQAGLRVSTELPGTRGEHLGSAMGQMEVEEDTFEEEMLEEERGGPPEELEEVVNSEVMKLSCSSSKCLIFLAFVLLLSARELESRHLTPSVERRKNLSLSIERTKEVGREAMKNQKAAWPKRSSPGGPDQQHH